MHGARDEFLAGAVLTGDQHARTRLRDFLNLVDQPANPARAADDLVARFDLRLELRIFLGEINPPNRIAQRDENAIRIERLFENVIGAELRRLDGVLNRRVAADHHHGCRRIAIAELLERFETVHSRHLHVEKDELRLELFVCREPFSAGRCAPHLVALEFEELRECGANAGFVVDDQNATVHGVDL
jgi:hypothetical protein